MKIVFYSNFLNHHQLQLCMSFLKLTDNNFYFVATDKIPEERLRLGYKDINTNYSFVIRSYESKEQFEFAMSLSLICDVAIIGSAPDVFIKERIKRNLITFWYMERIFKKDPVLYKIPYWTIKNYIQYQQYKKQYVLCASAYTAEDFRLTHSFLNRTYKWGYFPETIKYDNIDELIKKKNPNSILWAGRLIDWKHPEYALFLSKKLQENGYSFCMNIIGTGYMEKEIQKMIEENSLQDSVHLLEAMSPEQVRAYMELSEVYVFTSDRNEGWGAVLNESMNSGCAVVASNEIGSVPFLIDDNINGMIYKKNDLNELYKKVIELLNNKDKRKQLAYNAYNTIVDTWNAEEAAKRLIILANELIAGRNTPFIEGPCSIAQ